MIRTFTGRHMLGCCIAFFGTIVAVNMVMAVQASRTFGGTVVDNSYIASQHFNRWLDEAKAERRLGWRIGAARDGDHVLLTLDGPGRRITDAIVTGIAQHPLGRKGDIPLTFAADGKGALRSVETIAAGRWRLKLDVRVGPDRSRMLKDIAA